MRIAIYWEYFQHYHCARVGTAMRLLSPHQIFAASLAGCGNDAHRADSGGWNLPVEILVADKVDAPRNNRAIAARLVQWLEQTQPDVVCIPGYVGKASRAAVHWCQRRRRGAVLMFETQAKDRPRPYWKELLKRRVVRRYDAGFTGGSEHRNYLIQLGMDADRVVTGYDAVDNEFFAHKATEARRNERHLRSSLNIPDHYFIAVGRMIEKKGLPFLVNCYRTYAVEQENAGLPVWGLVLVGDGPLRDAILSMAGALPSSARLILPGYLDTASTSQYLSLADAFIMPSIREEQWGLVINEAMAAGVPVLGSDICGATTDLVVEGKTGFRFAPGDENRLVELMCWGTAHSSRLSDMGRQAARHVQLFGLENFSENLLRASEIAARHVTRR